MTNTTENNTPTHRIRARGSRRWTPVSLAEAAAIAQIDADEIEWAIEGAGYASTEAHIVRPAR